MSYAILNNYNELKPKPKNIASRPCVQNIVTTHTVIVVKSVSKTTVIWLLRLSLGSLKQTILAIGNEAWDDNRISTIPYI